MKPKVIEDALKLVGLPGVGNIMSLFRLMEVAEEEIAKACKGATVEEQKAINEVFGAACPPQVIRGKDECVYRAHVRELCTRAKTGGKLDEPTEAECLCVLLAQATVHPLSGDYAFLADQLFTSVFGKSIDETTFRESYPGAAKEALIDVRRATARIGR